MGQSKKPGLMEWARERAFRGMMWAMPKSVKAKLEDQIAHDTNLLNQKVLDAQGFVRCAVCPERFGGGLRKWFLEDGRKVYLCGNHYGAARQGTLVLG